MLPPMAGFIEFALMRTRGDIDQKYLSELYYQYINVEEDFVKDLFFATETRLGRVFVQEPVLGNDKMNIFWISSGRPTLWKRQNILGLVPVTAATKLIMQDTPARSMRHGRCA